MHKVCFLTPFHTFPSSYCKPLVVSGDQTVFLVPVPHSTGVEAQRSCKHLRLWVHEQSSGEVCDPGAAAGGSISQAPGHSADQVLLPVCSPCSFKYPTITELSSGTFSLFRPLSLPNLAMQPSGFNTTSTSPPSGSLLVRMERSHTIPLLVPT